MSKISAFDPSLENWQRFVLRLQQYFIAERIPDDNDNRPVRRAKLLQLMGIQLFNKLCDSVVGGLDNLAFDQIVDRVEALINPAPLEIAERYSFLNRRQLQSESAANFMLELRRLSLTCNFANDAANPLNARLCDQFVCGLQDREMQKFLLQQQQLTVDNVVTFATQFEMVGKTTELLNQPTFSKSDVHSVKLSTKQKSLVDKREKKPVVAKFPKCKHCGKTNHPENKCFKIHKCEKCGKVGHTPKVCNSERKFKPNVKSAYANEDEEEVQSDEAEDSNYICTIKNFDGTAKYFVDLLLNGHELALELDTGTGETILNKEDWEALGSPKLSPTKVKFRSYSGHELLVLGCAEGSVKVSGQKFSKMPFYVVNGNRNSLLGRRWVDKLNIDCKNCRRQKSRKSPEVAILSPAPSPENFQTKELLTEFSELFDGKLGCIKGIKVSLTVASDKQNIRKFWSARPVPFAIEKKVEMELDRLEKRGIIERIPNDISEYASPIVVVAKRNTEAVRICGDFKVSVNKMLAVEKYPLPSAEELFAKIGNCKYFAKLDMEEAYHQLELDDEAQKFLVVNTKKGLYRYKRLAFGISSAPSIFQRTMDNVLRGLPGVICYLDDTTVAGRTPEELQIRLKAVFQRLKEYGIRLNLSKCIFGEKSIKYLGHIIDGEGLHTTPDKIEAIQNAPAPKSVTELRSFLGLVNYYGKFIKNLSTLCGPLYQLLHKDTSWNWTTKQEKAFQKLKVVISTPPVLCHYNPELKIGLATDASQYGVGAVLYHIFEDGSERPIAFASQTLNSAQRNYSQIDKEAYGIVFGVSKFRQYLYGRKFLLVTDHKPLLALLGSDKPIPDRASSRLQRWALILMAYSYDLQFKPTSKHGNADGLSRLPLKESNLEDVFDVDDLSISDLSNKSLREATDKDKILSKVIRCLNGKWSEPCPNDLMPYFIRREELSVENFVLYWKKRIVIPTVLRSEVLDELHQGHLGMTKMKNLARNIVWWPKLDELIEKTVQKCQLCQSMRPAASAAPVHPWEFPEKSWYRLHIDFAEKHGFYWLVVIDARTKWPEVIRMKSATTATTVQALLEMISRFGIPAQIVSDNGPQFTSDEFRLFCQRMNIQHIKTSPYHPRSNGEAERFVRSLKGVLGKDKISDERLSYRLSKFLLAYRNSAHTTTGSSPAELLLGHRVRLPLDALQFQPEDKVRISQNKQASPEKSVRKFSNGDTVWARDYRHNKWVAGVIMHQSAPLSYKVLVGENLLWRRHIDQLLIRNPECNNPLEVRRNFVMPPPTVLTTGQPSQIAEPVLPSSTEPSSSSQADVAPPILRRSLRTIKKPVRYGMDSA